MTPNHWELSMTDEDRTRVQARDEAEARTPGHVLYDELGRPQRCAWATLPAWHRERYEAHARGIHDWQQTASGAMRCCICLTEASEDAEDAA